MAQIFPVTTNTEWVLEGTQDPTKPEKQLYYIAINLILFSNSRIKHKLDSKRIMKMVDHIDDVPFRIVPVYKTDRGYLLTDGNHHVMALKLAGKVHVPAIILTEEEYKKVAYGAGEIDVTVITRNAQLINSL